MISSLDNQWWSGVRHRATFLTSTMQRLTIWTRMLTSHSFTAPRYRQIFWRFMSEGFGSWFPFGPNNKAASSKSVWHRKWIMFRKFLLVRNNCLHLVGVWHLVLEENNHHGLWPCLFGLCKLVETFLFRLFSFRKFTWESYNNKWPSSASCLASPWLASSVTGGKLWQWWKWWLV